jgi:hypothetical protein
MYAYWIIWHCLYYYCLGLKDSVISCSVSWTNECEDHRAKEFMHKQLRVICFTSVYLQLEETSSQFIGPVILFAGRLRCDWAHIISFPHSPHSRLSGNGSIFVVLAMAARSNISETVLIRRLIFENFFLLYVLPSVSFRLSLHCAHIMSLCVLKNSRN